MRRFLSLILAIVLLIACFGCYWGVEHDRRGYDDRDRGGYGERDRGERGDQDRGGIYEERH